jgi:asparagine synthase (glutamine-hydrolysing)
MCGIAAVISYKGSVSELLDMSKLRHRGPDSAGQWLSSDGKIWLACARLAIVELTAAGDQPMADPETGNVIVMNGEIYNHMELRSHDKLKGIQWTGRSDTETVLRAYSVFGEKVVEHLRGMFAFIIFDPGSDSVFLARDRLGIKPLYYTYENGRWFFSSETRLFRSNAISPAGLGLYLRHGACRDPELILENVRALPAGNTMTLTALNDDFTREYWPSDAADTRPATLRSVSDLLEKSVKEHLMSDIPLVSFLSGGMDSALVTGLAARHYGKKMRTFTLCFPDRAIDESGIAKKTAAFYGTDHTEIALSDEEISSWIKDGVRAMDLPSVDALNTYVICRAARAYGAKAALSGLGGDELFGGYPSFRIARIARNISNIPAAGKILSRLGHRFERFSDISGRRLSLPEAAERLRTVTTDSDLSLFGLPIPISDRQTYPGVKSDFGRIGWAEISGYMKNVLLRDTDQMSMSVSMEIRVPFLDHRLVEANLSLDRPVFSSSGGKKILAGLFRDILPLNQGSVPKKPFLLPMAELMRTTLHDFSREGLIFAERRVPDARSFLETLAERFSAGKLGWPRLWTWVVLGHWMESRNISAPVRWKF